MTAPTKFQRKNHTRRRALIAAALAANPYAEVYQDLKPCAAGHALPCRYVKSGHCVACLAGRYQRKATTAEVTS
jgi:hypothetical protein